MMRTIRLLLILFLITGISACVNSKPTKPTDTKPTTDEGRLVSRVAQTKSGRPYIEVDGLPFVYNGAQIRVDWLVDVEKETIDDLEYYFQICADLGVNMVEIPVQWKDLEPKKDAYDFRNLFKMINMAKKYNLRVELLLFTVNITGMTGCVPNYIRDDEETYPQYENDLNHPDALFFVQDNPNILEREGLMVEALMDAIYQWSVTNDSNTVISIQVRNEPDLYVKRVFEHNIRENGVKLTRMEALEETVMATDYIAKIVKASKYKVITRVNLCCFSEHPLESYENWEMFTKLESLDFIGEDTYNPTINFNKGILLDMKAKIVDKYNAYPQIAENTGNYVNNGSLILMSNLLGAGYALYDLITPKTIVNEWDYYDWGLLNNETKLGKEAYEPTKKMLKGINLAGPYTVTTDEEDFAGFNLISDYPKQELEQVIQTSKSTYKFKTTKGAVGYALNVNDYIYLFATEDWEIEITNTTLASTYQQGYVLADGTFICEESFNLSNNHLILSGGKLYRIKTVELGDLVSNTIDNLKSN